MLFFVTTGVVALLFAGLGFPAPLLFAALVFADLLSARFRRAAP
jgi:hypothetical protein